MEIRKVGVVGCGTVGSGITQVCAQSGYKVIFSGRDDERLKKRLDLIGETLKRSAEKGKITQEEKDNTLSRNHIDRFYQDSKIVEIYEGTKEIEKMIIARALQGRC
jgi:3-hydroxybutyryl-CoA dehydrogenase